MYPPVISQIKSVTSELFHCTLTTIGALRFTYKETVFEQNVFLTSVPTTPWKPRFKSKQTYETTFPQWLFTAETESLQHFFFFILLLIILWREKMLYCFVLCGWCSHFPAEFGSTFIEGVKYSELASISKMTQWSLRKWEDFKRLTLLLTFLLSQMQMLGNLNSFLSCHFKILKGPLIIRWPVKYLAVRKKAFFFSFWWFNWFQI